jgi:hypothetical protein
MVEGTRCAWFTPIKNQKPCHFSLTAFDPLPSACEPYCTDLFTTTPSPHSEQMNASTTEDPNAYSASVPGKAGTCSCHVVVLPSVPEETAKKIALSLGPAQE